MIIEGIVRARMEVGSNLISVKLIKLCKRMIVYKNNKYLKLPIQNTISGLETHQSLEFDSLSSLHDKNKNIICI